MNATVHAHIKSLFNDLMQTDFVQLDPDWLKAALFRVPRHLFIEQYYDPEAPEGIVQVEPSKPTRKQLETIYADRGLMIRETPHSAASQPSLIFGMLVDLELTHGRKVLEIGTGSGWNAGLIAFGVGAERLVYSIDLQADLVEKAQTHLGCVGFNHVNLRVGDGGLGWDGETFDRIILTVGSADISPAWIEALAEGGLLVMPLKTRCLMDPILRLQKQDGKLRGKFTRSAGFMNLQGAFYSASENLLVPPWDPVIESLLQEVPTSVSLPTICETDCAFWLHLKGEPIEVLGAYRGHKSRTPVLLDKELPAVYVPQSGSPFKPEKRMDVYGDHQRVDNFIKGMEEWVALGKPRYSDYRIELINPAEADTVAFHSYIDKRPNATLKFSLEAVPILRDRS